MPLSKNSMQWVCILLLIFLVNVAHAHIFRCTDAAGLLRFQDRPCDGMQTQDLCDVQDSLVLSDPTLKSNQSPAEAKKNTSQAVQEARQAMQQEKKSKKEAQQEAKAQRRAQRLRARTAQWLIQEQQAAARARLRCQKTDERIQGIQNQLRLGCDTAICTRLKEQLAQQKALKKQHCVRVPS